MTDVPTNRGRPQTAGWRNRGARSGAGVRNAGNTFDGAQQEQRAAAPTMSRSRVQLATTYAPGVLFTWEGAKGICRAVPLDRGEMQVSDATRLMVFDGIKEMASS